MMWLRNLLRKNLPAKIIALLVAATLWIFVMSDQNPAIDGSFTVPIDFVNAPEGYKISATDKTVKLKVRAPRSFFISAQADDFKAYIDLSGTEEGRQDMKVQTVLPQGFELSSVPEPVSIVLEKFIQKNIKANLIVSGAAAAGTTVANIGQSQELVQISGPRSAVAEVDRVIGYVGLSGNSDDFSIKIPLTAVNIDGKAVDEVSLDPGYIEAFVQLARGLSKKIVDIKPVYEDSLPDGYALGKVRIDPAKIEIAGDSNILSSINSINTVGISLLDRKEPFIHEIGLAVPEGVTVTNKMVAISVDIVKKK